MLALRRFSQNLRKLRIAAGLSQEMLAERAGVSAAYVGMLERSERNPPLTTVQALADALGTDVGALLGNDGAPRPLRLEAGAAGHVLHLFRSEVERRQVATRLLEAAVSSGVRAACLSPNVPRQLRGEVETVAPELLPRTMREVEPAKRRLQDLFGRITQRGNGVYLETPPNDERLDPRVLTAYATVVSQLVASYPVLVVQQVPASLLDGPQQLELLAAHHWLLASGGDGLIATPLNWTPVR